MTHSGSNGDGQVVHELRPLRGDADIAAAAADGDAQAWEQLVRVHAQLVWDTVRLHGLDTVDAAQVCQLVWLRCADQLTGLALRGAVREWLVATADTEAARAARADGATEGARPNAC